MKTNILATLLALTLVFLFAGTAQSQQKFIAALNSVQVVPSTTSRAAGTCDITYFRSQEYLYLSCRFSGLETGLMDGHLHVAATATPDNPANKLYNLPVPIGETNGQFEASLWFPELFTSALRDKELNIDLHTENLLEGEVRGQVKVLTMDYDADGDARADAFVARSVDMYQTMFYTLRSMDNSWTTGDFPLPMWRDRVEPLMADFDGDGVADLAAVHYSQEDGSLLFYYLQSTNSEMKAAQWGNFWYYDDRPVLGYFDNDSKVDVGVYRPVEGNWYILQSTDGQPMIVNWGIDLDVPCTGDFDRDGMTDLCVVREVTDQLVWYIRRSSDYQLMAYAWGRPGDKVDGLRPADIDGDLMDDPVIIRDEKEHWNFYGLRSSDQTWDVVEWGLVTDRPRYGDYDGNGTTDFVAIRPQEGQLAWYVRYGWDDYNVFNWGLETDK